MREIRTFGSEGGGGDSPYPYEFPCINKDMGGRARRRD